MKAVDEFLRARDFLLEHREDYQTAYQGFSWPKLDTFNWALDYFDTIAKNSDRPALVVAEESGETLRLSFSDLSRRSAQVANYLRSLGLRRGDRLLLMLDNVVPIWELMLAAMKLGLVIIPAATLLTPSDLADRVRRGAAGAVVTSRGKAVKFDEVEGNYLRISVDGAPPGWLDYRASSDAAEVFVPGGPTSATDPLLLYFTSGTTSKPKLVRHTQVSYPVGHLSTMYWIGLLPGDIHWNISSPGWAKHAWSSFFAPWNAEATVFVYNYQRFEAQAALRALADHQVTTLCAPPTVWRLFIQQDLGAYPVSLREVVGAGEPLNPEIIEQVRRAWKLVLRDGYGQTETTAQVGNTPGQPLKPGSMGRALPGYQVALLDADGRPAGSGEIALSLDPKPIGLMQGYADNPERTREAMQGSYYRTGDVADMDDEGYITYVGRADDVFKSSDYRISPFELESVLLEHPAVAEAAVVPSPDPLRLAVPKAYIILRQGFTADADTARVIFAFIRERLAPYKRIRRLSFSDLPKTISGKIRRVQLRTEEVHLRSGPLRGQNEFWEEDFT